MPMQLTFDDILVIFSIPVSTFKGITDIPEAPSSIGFTSYTVYEGEAGSKVGKFISLMSRGLAIARISSAWFPVTVKKV